MSMKRRTLRTRDREIAELKAEVARLQRWCGQLSDILSMHMAQNHQSQPLPNKVYPPAPVYPLGPIYPPVVPSMPAVPPTPTWMPTTIYGL